VPPDSASFMNLLFEFIMFALVFNQLQLMMLSGAILFLSVFLTLGILARTLGFSRTFGGAMIAFGLGLGIIYPLLIAITYGFINVHVPFITACLQNGSITASCAISNIAKPVLALIFYSNTTASGANVASLFVNIGYVLVGLTIMPVMVIAIVDAFIVDFSRAIGEQMSFATLFSKFI